MPFCPKCKSEYRPGFTRCADCDVDLVAELEKETTVEGVKWVEIFRGEDAIGAAIRGALESAGLKTIAHGEYPLQSLNPGLGGIADWTFLYVRAPDEAQAREIIQGVRPAQ